MKLKLEAVRDVSVLVAEGPITPENFAVLRAGIKKLFKDGKNKIILELPDSGSLAPPILRELAVLNLLASELAGSIALAKIEPLTRAKIEAFSKPPLVRSFADREQAVEFFHPKSEEVPSKPAAAPIPAPVTPGHAASGASGEMKSDVRAREMGDLGTVRKKLAELEAENAELKACLGEMIVTRRDPPDLDAWKEKVANLEKQLADAIKTAQDAAGAKK